MKIGVIGLGTVGYGVVEILTNEKTRLEKEMKQEISSAKSFRCVDALQVASQI